MAAGDGNEGCVSLGGYSEKSGDVKRRVDLSDGVAYGVSDLKAPTLRSALIEGKERGAFTNFRSGVVVEEDLLPPVVIEVAQPVCGADRVGRVVAGIQAALEIAPPEFAAGGVFGNEDRLIGSEEGDGMGVEAEGGGYEDNRA